MDYQVNLAVFAPHPDDAELFCGGLLASTAARGEQIAVVDLSMAELSSYGNSEIREQEKLRANEILDIQHRKSLTLPNCWISEWDGMHTSDREDTSAVGRIVQVLRELRPEIVVIPALYDRHPDHGASGRLLERALFMAGLEKFQRETAPYRARQVLYYSMRYELTPTFVVDITAVAPAKYAAIRAYSSQISPPSDGREPTLLASSLSMSALEARDMYIGSLIGVRFGEGYWTRNMIRIDAVTNHFRSNPTDQACYFPPREM